MERSSYWCEVGRAVWDLVHGRRWRRVHGTGVDAHPELREGPESRGRQRQHVRDVRLITVVIMITRVEIMITGNHDHEDGNLQLGM
jgi:hypothetical protein